VEDTNRSNRRGERSFPLQASKEDHVMARLALVTGGVTGIGAATCRTLSEGGYRLAATFSGNAAEADQFRLDGR
jgi:hypothetical protein